MRFRVKGQYEIIQGKLDDLDQSGIDATFNPDATFYPPDRASPHNKGPKPWSEMRDHDGRNKELWRAVAREARLPLIRR